MIFVSKPPTDPLPDTASFPVRGVHSFFNKFTRLKIIPDRDVPIYGATILTC